MADKFSDPIGRLMGLRYKSHPWHGVHIGDKAPEKVTAFIEVVPTDTVKYEVDKDTGVPQNRPAPAVFERFVQPCTALSHRLIAENW